MIQGFGGGVAVNTHGAWCLNFIIPGASARQYSPNERASGQAYELQYEEQGRAMAIRGALLASRLLV